MKRMEWAARAMWGYRALPPYLRRHGRMVGRYAAILTEYGLRSLGCEFFQELPLEVLNHMHMIGNFHDIGKAAITDIVWKSERPLNESEQKLVWSHPFLGAWLIRGTVLLPEQEPRLPGLQDAAAQCCQYHHEHWDGSGYPFGIAGSDIPLPARIVGIADAYDAMTTDRPYHRGMSREHALEEIRRNAGRQFDPLLAQLFIRAVSGQTDTVIK
jgi:polar amino acid transport system substrate-binding protein